MIHYRAMAVTRRECVGSWTVVLDGAEEGSSGGKRQDTSAVKSFSHQAALQAASR